MQVNDTREVNIKGATFVADRLDPYGFWTIRPLNGPADLIDGHFTTLEAAVRAANATDYKPKAKASEPAELKSRVVSKTELKD